MIKNILEYFEKTAAESPEKVAVRDGDRDLTFSALAGAAKGLAIRLREVCGGETGRPVAVYLPKSIECIVADLGIVYAGNAYMNLDVKTPAQRIENILRNVQPLCVITDAAHREALPDSGAGQKLLLLDEGLPAVGPEEEREIYRTLEKSIDTDLLCLINTSGSTGTPKSVALCHRNYMDYTTWAIETMHLKKDELLGSIAPTVFDHFSYEFCLMLVHSCTLLLIPESYPSFPAKLLQLLAREHVTYLFWVPTLMVNIANMDLLSRIPLPDVRMVWFAGEVFPTRQFNYWRAHLPDATFVNLYGPTEITVDCTYYVIDRPLRDDEPIPIGFPCRNTDILILNQENRPAGPGEEGELCVRGSSLALGYYNDPEKTEAAFVQNPLNHAYPERIYRTGDLVYRNSRGEIVYKGRNDCLIKHAGKRIELGEIEHVAVNTLGVVGNGCAVYDDVHKKIVFFYEAEQPADPAELRRELASQLPRYMIPGCFIHMEQLPRNTNGKIDRARLKNEV